MATVFARDSACGMIKN